MNSMSIKEVQVDLPRERSGGAEEERGVEAMLVFRLINLACLAEFLDYCNSVESITMKWP